jgi:phosphatidylglycerophosphate synthase
MRRPGLLSAPNVVSLSRLVLAALFVVFGSTQARLILLATALLTDGLDGWLARRLDHGATRAGALIDAIADRVFVLTVVCALVADGALTLLESFVLLIRDIATFTGFVVARAVPALRGVAFKARLAGKTVTVLQYAALAASLALPDYVAILVLLTGIISVAAVVDYTVSLWRGMRDAQSSRQADS